MADQFVASILQAAIQRAINAETDPAKLKELKTLTGKAKLLKTDKGTLSRILSGAARIGPKLADQFAERLCTNPPDRRQLSQELQDAARAELGDVHAVRAFFERLAHPKALTCVEYRDYPRADPQGKYSQYAQIAGESVSRRMSFAMILPYPTVWEEPGLAGECYPRAIRYYIWGLRRKVISAYMAIRREAMAAAEKHGEAGNQWCLDDYLVLYEAQLPKDSYPLLLPGIQSRLFYAEVANPGNVSQEVWEWVAGEERDFFVERDRSSTPFDVISAQYYPIIGHWRTHHRLPKTQRELEKAFNDYAAEFDAKFPQPFLRVAEPPANNRTQPSQQS